MPVQTTKKVSEDKVKKPVLAPAGDSDSQNQPVGTRVGKEQDAIYTEQGELLREVQEKYKEADLEAQKQVEEALGKESKLKETSVVPPDVEDAGVVEREEEASRVLKHGSDLALPVTEDEYEAGEKTNVGGKRMINKNVVGVPSLAALAIFVGKLLKVAHKHARRVIFRKSGSGSTNSSKGGSDAG